MLGNITATRSKIGKIYNMETTFESLSGVGGDEYAEDLNDYFGENPFKGLYKDHLS